MYGVSQSTLSRIYRTLMPLLDQVLCINEPNIHRAFRNREVLIDGTDVPTRTRKGAAQNYSGKRHRQGLNIHIAAATNGSSLAASDPMPVPDMTDGRSPNAAGKPSFRTANGEGIQRMSER